MKTISRDFRNRNEADTTAFDIGIIGGGASGIILLLHLIKQATGSLSLLLFNSGYPLSKGVAYSTTDQDHLLNVRAGRMSLYADEPLHFVEWLKKQQEYPAALGQDNDQDAFVPRYLYGRYLSETFQNVLDRLPDHIQVHIAEVKVIEISKNEIFTIKTETGELFHVHHAALCTGIESPVQLPGIKELPADERIHINPWINKNLSVKSEEHVLLIGTGLTMVDHVLSLINSDFKGSITALSKHGQLHLAHPEHKQSLKSDIPFIPPADLKGLFSLIKKRIKEHPDPQGWEEPVLEDIRPYTQQLWFNYSTEEKQQFLRHLQHLWSKLRHRIPYNIYLQLKSAIDHHQLKLAGGFLTGIEIQPQQLLVTFKNRKKNSNETIVVNRIINCTGPVLDVDRSTNPLIRSLSQQGLIRNSASKLGPDAMPDGRLIDKAGKTHEDFFTLGPPLRGVIWEAVAVPEIRVGSKEIARIIISRISSKDLLQRTGDH